jgi:predicted ATPase
LWFLGYPDQALKKSQEALTLAEELSHPVSLALALYGAVVPHLFRREWQIIQERTEALLPLAAEHGFAFRVSRGTMLRGRMLVEQGQVEEGFAQLRQGIAADHAIGAEVGRPYQLILLAEAYGKVGQVDEGLHALAEGLTVAHNTGEGWYEPELYRLTGELTLQQAGSRLQAVGGREKLEEVEKCFMKAIEVAQKQRTKSLELRAVMSLSRLWQSQGKKDEARQMLAEVYGWFTEGFDTRDLQEAKALLEELT